MLSWAKLALDLGARPSVVERITGIDHKELIRVFFASGPARKSPGAFPSSAEWFMKPNLIVAIQAADFYAHFDKLRHFGTRPAEALIKAYEKHKRMHERDLRLSFDRSFDLVTHVDGIWTTTEPELQAIVCDQCRSLFITSLGDRNRGPSQCPFCKLGKRYGRSGRLSKPFTVPLFGT
jgi:hypothetical protein